MNNLTPERLAEIERRANAATPGPWRETQARTSVGVGYIGIADGVQIGDRDCTVGHQHLTAPTSDTSLPNGLVETKVTGPYTEPQPNADAAFIAHAREDIPDLIQHIRLLEARIRERENGRDDANH